MARGKGSIFSGRAPSAREKASINLQLKNLELKRAGLEPVRPGSSSKEALEKALEKALESIKQEEERLEKDRRKSLKARYKKADAEASTADSIAAIMDVLTKDEQKQLREYDSDDIIAIGELYIENPDFSMEDAAEAHRTQQMQAFQDMEDGEAEEDFEGVPFL